MRKHATYQLTDVPITGTIAKRYNLAVETQTVKEYKVVCKALIKEYGLSAIETLHELPKSLSPHYAIFTRNPGQYLIFLNGVEERNFVQDNLSKQGLFWLLAQPEITVSDDY